MDTEKIAEAIVNNPEVKKESDDSDNWADILGSGMDECSLVDSDETHPYGTGDNKDFDGIEIKESVKKEPEFSEDEELNMYFWTLRKIGVDLGYNNFLAKELVKSYKKEDIQKILFYAMKRFSTVENSYGTWFSVSRNVHYYYKGDIFMYLAKRICGSDGEGFIDFWKLWITFERTDMVKPESAEKDSILTITYLNSNLNREVEKALKEDAVYYKEAK